jgi:hypothetical protein
MRWNPVPNEHQPPELRQGKLVLDGGIVRSDISYTTPVMIRCDVDFSSATNGAFYIDFVPLAALPTGLPRDFATVKLDSQATVSASIAHAGETTDWLKPSAVSRAGRATHRIRVEAQRERLTVTVDGMSFDAVGGVPYERFYVQLRSTPPPTPARVLNISFR